MPSASIPAVFSVGSSLLGASSKSAEANYQAQVAANNATIARQNAAYASAAGSEQATEESLKGAAVGGRIKASQAANGIDVNSGSAVDVQVSQREASKLDTLNVENNALLQAYGYKVQASNFDAEAKLDKSESQDAWIEGLAGGAGGFLGNSNSLGYKWLGLQSG